MSRRAFFSGLVLLVASGEAARADAIDGDWCSTTGRRMSIRGPDIVTPGGQRIRGDYDRHFFSYVVPAGEPGAGDNVSITLLSEYLAHSRQGSASAPVVVWNRCQPGVSDAGPPSGRADRRQERVGDPV